MSAAELQACAARLYVDATYRRLLGRDPGAALAEYRLTDEEQEALLGLDRERLELFASTLKQKRRSRLEEAYPALFRLQPPDFAFYCDRYFQLRLAWPEGSPAEDAFAFGRFMADTLAATEEAPPWAADLARYELVLYASSQSSGATPLSHAASAAAAGPRLSPGIRLERYRYDVPRLASELLAGKLPEPIEEECAIAFRERPEDSLARAFRLSAATADLLELCDGSRPVPDIAAHLERTHGRPMIPQEIDEILQRLRDLRVIEG